MRRVTLAFLLAGSALALAQEVPPPGNYKDVLEAERREQLQKKSAAEEARMGLDKPAAERPRDQHACNSARTYYQSVCGSAHVPKSGNRRCAEADMLVRQSC